MSVQQLQLPFHNDVADLQVNYASEVQRYGFIAIVL